MESRSPSSARLPSRDVRPLAGRTIAVFGSSTIATTEGAWTQAEAVGRALATAGALVVTGGYGGVMEAACRGANHAGGKPRGVTLTAAFPERTPNPWIGDHVDAPTLIDRLRHLFDVDAFVVLEGGVGTLAEFFVAWHHSLIEGARRRPLVCLGSRWPALLAALGETGFVTDTDLLDHVNVTSEIDEMLALLVARLASDEDPKRANE